MVHLPVNTLLQGGKYRIVRFINSGGFGCTYEAEHVMFRKRVTIKEFFVKDFCGRDERTAYVTVETTSKRGLVDKLKRKFIDEARSIFDLHHPGIVRVTDVFEENDTAYYVMDYINGKSLKEIVDKEGALPESRALGYIRQVADALEYVHAHNRLHLDIKPGNIMIDDNDRAVLIDFGASRQYEEVGDENTSTLIPYTNGYAPPEQVGSELVKLTPATDLYALGATLYCLLSGCSPVSSNLRNSGEKLQSLPASTSFSTRRGVEKAMMLNRYERLQSVDAFRKELDCVADVMSFDNEKTEVSSDLPESSKLKEQQNVVMKFLSAPFNNCILYVIIACCLIGSALFLYLKCSNEYVAESVELMTESVINMDVLLKYDDYDNYVSEGMVVVKKNGLEGFIDLDGNEVIPCIYDFARSFSDGLAHCVQNGNSFFIDKKGRKVISLLDYDWRYINSFSDGRARISDKDDRFGFIDKTGREVIPPVYDVASDFSEGLSLVKKDGKCGYIDTLGSIIIPIDYDNAKDFNSGVAPVRRNGKWGVIDRKGNVVVKFIYDEVEEFRNGLAKVRKDLKWGLINNKGQEITLVEYEDIDTHEMKDGLLLAQKDGKYCFVNKDGKDVFICEKEPRFVEDSTRIFACVEKNGSYGLVDRKFRTVLACIYDDLKQLNNGLYKAKKEGKWGIIDYTGEEYIPFIYDGIEGLNSGLYLVEQNEKWGMINSLGNEIQPIIYDYYDKFYGYEKHIKVTKGDFPNEKQGIIDIFGNIIIPVEFDYISDNYWGYEVRKNNSIMLLDRAGNQIIQACDELKLCGERILAVKRNGKWGFVNPATGKEVISFIYDVCYDFSEGLIAVGITTDEYGIRMGYIDKKGHEIIPFEYDRTWIFREGLASVEKNGRCGFINKNNDVIIPFKYSSAGYFHNGYAIVMLDGKYGVIDRNDNLVIPFKYDGIRRGANNWFQVEMDGKRGVYVNGQELLSCIYERVCLDRWGVAEVTLNGEDMFINKYGERIDIE